MCALATVEMIPVGVLHENVSLCTYAICLQSLMNEANSLHKVYIECLVVNMVNSSKRLHVQHQQHIFELMGRTFWRKSVQLMHNVHSPQTVQLTC